MNKKLLISFSFVVISIIVLVLTLTFNQNDKFVKPEFDKNVLGGVPNVSNSSYSEINYSEGYSVKLCGEPELKDNKLYLYLTSLESNNIMIKARIYKDDKIVGESGLMNPNSYLEYINVENLKNGDKIKIKIMGYDKDYHSAGAINMNVTIK